MGSFLKCMDNVWNAQPQESVHIVTPNAYSWCSISGKEYSACVEYLWCPTPCYRWVVGTCCARQSRAWGRHTLALQRPASA